MDMKVKFERARHHIIFLLALIVGSFLIYYLNELDLRKKGLGIVQLKDMMAPKILHKPRKLTKKDLQNAKVAWKYFENNYNEETGLVNSVDNYPSTTLWDTGNYMMALIGAKELKIITKEEFDRRLKKLLESFKKMKLYKGLLPNKVYNTKTLKMTDYQNRETPEGIGWSAIDIGRVLIPFTYIIFNYPEYSKDIKEIVSRWNVKKMVKEGVLYGAVVEKGKERLLQEGRLGYEQFTSKMFATFGVDITNAIRYDKYLEFVDIYGIDIPYDLRDKEHSDANNYVLMEPYMLDGMEFGWDYFSKEFSYRLYLSQLKRYEKTKILTAVTEDHLDKEPYFIYNCIYVNKKKWVAIDEKGNVKNEFKQLSTKASFAMDALYDTDYTKLLMKEIENLKSDRGWYTGIYEKDKSINKSINCNTNAIVLESIFYKVKGPIIQTIKNR